MNLYIIRERETEREKDTHVIKFTNFLSTATLVTHSKNNRVGNHEESRKRETNRFP